MGARAAVLTRVLGNRSLRHIGVAFAGFGAAEYGVWTAMLVYAYRQGGATTAGIVAVAQLIPAALIGPPAAAVADARGGLFALRFGYLWQARSWCRRGAARGGDHVPSAGGSALRRALRYLARQERQRRISRATGAGDRGTHCGHGRWGESPPECGVA